MRTLSQADLDRLDVKVGNAPDLGTYEWTNPVTGEFEQIPNGVGPEWNYAPGASQEAQRERIFAGMLSRMNADLRAQVEAAVSG